MDGDQECGKERLAETPTSVMNMCRRYGSVALLLIVILLVGTIRYRLRNFPLERDEGEYAYAGQLILQGVPPYQLAYNMKLPGTYAAYAIILALFGQTASGIHLGLILVNSITVLLVFVLACKLSGQIAGLVAAVSYALLSLSSSVMGMAGHATHFVVLAAVAGLVLLLRALESKQIHFFVSSGVLLGIGFLMKQPGIFFVAFASAYALCRECASWPPRWPFLFKRASAFVLGAAAPFGLTCLLLAATGTFDKFWFWTITYARAYGSILTPSQGAELLRMVFPRVVGPSLPIWGLAGAGITACAWDRDARVHAPFLVGFALFSFAAVCPGFYFREHYFILLLPAVAVLAGVGVCSVTRTLLAHTQSWPIASAPVILFVLMAGYTVYQQRALFFVQSPVVACREIYGGNPFPEAVEIAKYINANTAPGERIAVLGSEPEIYFYSRRRAATGYVYTYALMEPQPYALKMQREMIAEIESAQPAYLVFVQVPTSWLPRPDSERLIFRWVHEYIQQRFDLVGVADIGERTQYTWGEAAKEQSLSSPYTVYVFKRNKS